MHRISRETARRVMLAAQGLSSPPIKPASKGDLLACIRQMYMLQIDTIHVIARSPYVVLWSRLGDYERQWLDELLAEGALFEYWAHAMCFLPTEDYPLWRRRMVDAMASGIRPAKWALSWSRDHVEVIDRVRAYLRANGEARSAEFERTERALGGWWNWKEEKDALEALLILGEVMIVRRQNFQRVYDLRERVLPDWDDSDMPSSEELARTQALRTVKALGVAAQSWVADYFRQYKTGLPKRLAGLAREGLLEPVEIDGLSGPAFVHRDRRELMEEAAAGGLEPTTTTLLSPFDPLVWDRERASDLFDFDYKIECYTPAPKRRYGYFSLPILHRGRLVGRLDPKAHRAKGVFEVRSLHLEPDTEVTDELVVDLGAALRRFARWHETPEVQISQSRPAKLKRPLLRAVRG